MVDREELRRLIGTAKLHGLDPEAYLRTVLERIAEYPINRIEELMPWNLASARRGAARSRVASPSGASEGLALVNIAALIDNGGQITLGALHPIACVAIANDDHNSLAMLQRRPGETLHQLLQRLDAAVDLAWNEDQFTDEINQPPSDD